MIRGAIFDMDGTLLDSMGIWEDVGVRYLASRHIQAEENLSEILFPMSLEEGASYLKRRYRLSLDVQEIISGILSVIRDFYVSEVTLKPGAAHFLEELCRMGIPLAAATSSDRELIEAACRRLGILGCFQQIFTCSEIGVGKESPKIYLEAAAALGAPPEEIFVFEDALFALATAKRAGFHTAAVYDASSARDAQALRNCSDLYLEDLTDFPGFWKAASR
ncbi:MAG TPA: HAD family phosphatase [Candidatus Egerieimonas faecigallinarum]|nr:HAD family phosphatase [Candidatus Egerieimonas faecigallinarum]